MGSALHPRPLRRALPLLALTCALMGAAPATSAPVTSAPPSDVHWTPMPRDPTPWTRPTLRLSPYQQAARRWWQADGLDHRPDAVIEALAEALRAGPRGPEEAARLERVELDLLRRRFKGTHDIAGVALAFYRLEQAGIIQPFRWTANAGDWNQSRMVEVDDVLYDRVNNCFCFLNLCAWLAGDQAVDARFRPVVSHGAWGSPLTPGFEPLDRPLVPGEVVVVDVWFPGFNNIYRFHHIGVVVEDGDVVHLSSKDLNKDPLHVAFKPWKRGIYVGQFDWAGMAQEYRP